MKQQSPMLRLWELGEGQQGGLKRAVLSAVVGVLFGMLPYFAAAQIILGLLKGEQSMQYYLIWCVVALVGFLLRATLYSLALSISHKATFSILKSIREKILEKLPKMPLGTILDTSSGQMKQVIVDQVESMERPLAHLLPEMTANVLGPVCILIYLFVLDWRMALLSLVSIPVGMAFMMAVMANYGKQYEGSVKTTQAMNSAIVEYIGGIEVIKAFNQGKQSYARFSDSVKANASYFYHWMKSCQLPISLSKAISPTTMITILPVGWLLYAGGSLPVETFITTIVLSLGIAGPLLSAMDFVDSLAKVGTIVGSVDEILNGQEQDHGNAPVQFQGRDIALSHVSFTAEPGQTVALVGPSGGGKTTAASLIPRFWDATSGVVKVGGVDVRQIDPHVLMDQIAFVFQNSRLFKASILENVRAARPNATREQVLSALKAAQCEDILEKLPQGIDTLIGSEGTYLSGGEQQRIALARAILKDAPIVVLDEATAGDVRDALDHAGLEQRGQRLDIDLGGGEQHVAELFAAQLVEFGVHGVAGLLEQGLAHQGEAIGMHAGGGKADQHVAFDNRGTIDYGGLLGHAHGETGQIVLVLVVHARHLGGLAAHQRTAGLTAAVGDTRDDGLDLLGFVAPHGHVVEEHQRFGALRQHVVDAHGHGINADRVVLVHLEGQLEFGSHAVGPAHEHRFLHLEGRKIEHTAEGADIAHHTQTRGRGHMLFDAPHHFVSGFEIHASLFITLSHSNIWFK